MESVWSPIVFLKMIAKNLHNKIINGDCLKELKKNSMINGINLKVLKTYDKFTIEWLSECKKIIKENGLGNQKVITINLEVAK